MSGRIETYLSEPDDRQNRFSKNAKMSIKAAGVDLEKDISESTNKGDSFTKVTTIHGVNTSVRTTVTVSKED
jgi:hypothetical protein